MHHGTIPIKTLRETVVALRGLARRSAGTMVSACGEGTEVSALMTRLAGVVRDHEDYASELVHVGQMAVLAGFDVDVLVEATFNFPTRAEGYRVAALDIVKQRGG